MAFGLRPLSHAKTLTVHRVPESLGHLLDVVEMDQHGLPVPQVLETHRIRGRVEEVLDSSFGQRQLPSEIRHFRSETVPSAQATDPGPFGVLASQSQQDASDEVLETSGIAGKIPQSLPPRLPEFGRHLQSVVDHGVGPDLLDLFALHLEHDQSGTDSRQVVADLAIDVLGDERIVGPGSDGGDALVILGPEMRPQYLVLVGGNGLFVLDDIFRRSGQRDDQKMTTANNNR